MSFISHETATGLFSRRLFIYILLAIKFPTDSQIKREMNGLEGGRQIERNLYTNILTFFMTRTLGGRMDITFVLFLLTYVFFHFPSLSKSILLIFSQIFLVEKVKVKKR